ncbi:MAG TPA: hypothetical protein VHX39_15575, partial [Acetobacteraceae bacterium]|nr:hypothetical protein [Acetobacteraceae bacterium]
MDLQSAFTFQELLTFVISDMAKAISERSGETEEQHFARSRAAAHMILGFLPRDVIEAMLAGHCVMLHEVMTADAHDTLHGEADPQRRRPRSNIVGLNRAFNDTLGRLERHQQRPAVGSRDAVDVQPSAEPHLTPNVQPESTDASQPKPVAPMLNRAARRQAARAENRAAVTASRAAPRFGVVTPQPTVPRADPMEIAGLGSPSPEAIAACNANPEAMAALKSGDPAGFGRAMGIADPCEAFLAAAKTKGSPFDQLAS